MQIVSTRRPSPPSEVSEPVLGEFQREVLAEVRGHSRVALIGEEPVLRQRLQQQGCEVVTLALESLVREGAESTAARETLSASRPDVIVLAESWAQTGEPEKLLRELAVLCAHADVAIPFYNAASATALVAALTETEAPRALTEEGLTRWLTACGMKVRQRKVLQTSKLDSGLARETERALRTLFQQLNPRSSAHQVLYWSRHAAAGEEPVARERVPGLLSVVMRNHSLERLKFLDHAIFALSCQDYQPLEIVIVTQCQDPSAVKALTALLEKYRPLGEFTYQVLHEPADTDIRAKLANKGIAAARGQYLAFLDDDDVIYPQHYHDLIQTLRGGTAGWAVGRIRRAFFNNGPQDELYCRFKDEMVRGDHFELGHLIQDNYITCHSYVLDRNRLGQFQVGFTEEISLHEDYAFLLRLCALFRPAFPSGVPSCEYRLRDDGSNSVIHGGAASQKALREKHRKWSHSTVLKDAIKRGQQMLLTEQEFQDELDQARQQGRDSALDGALQHLQMEPRFRFINEANTLLKQRGPRAHRTIKSIIKRLF